MIGVVSYSGRNMHRIIWADRAARRGGALSWIRPLWLSPMATGGHPHRSTDSFTDFIPHNPPLLLITCPGVAHHLAYLTSVLNHTHCEVLFLPRLTFLSVYPSFWLLLLCLTPDCLTLELWTCACDPDSCLVLFTSLPCLWYSCFCPLTIACLILPLSNKLYCKWIHTPLASHYKM